MKTKKELDEIEANIDYFLKTYDDANKEGNIEILKKTAELLEYELGKLDRNEIHITTPEQ